MIDGISAIVHDVPVAHLREIPSLQWGRWKSETTGESLSHHCTVKFRGLKFTLADSGVLRISGSLHRYFNNGGPNNTIFTYADLARTVGNLSKMLAIRPESVILTKFEIGVNINTGETPAKKIVESAILFKNTKFSQYPTKNQFIGKIAEFDDYSIKLYAKDEYLLRFEIASNRSRYFEKFGIRSLADFLSREKYSALYSHLHDSVKNIIFFDKDWVSVFPGEEGWKYANPDFWSGLEPYKRRVEFCRFHTTLKEACITYWGDFLKDSMIELFPILVEEEPDINEEIFDFSTLGETWKSGNEEFSENICGPGRMEIKKRIFSGIVHSNGHADDFLGEYGLAWMSRDQGRIRSPPLVYLSFHQLQQ